MGRSACFMLEEIATSGKRLDFYCIDLFKITPDDGDGEMPWGENAKDWVERMDGDKLYEMAKWYIDHSPARDHLTEMIQDESADSAARFQDASVKFVFIDASHLYERVKQDIQAWWPKVKVGGVMSGHDWAAGEQVRQAVGEFAQSKGLQIQVADNVWIIEKKAPAFAPVEFKLSPLVP